LSVITSCTLALHNNLIRTKYLPIPLSPFSTFFAKITALIISQMRIRLANQTGLLELDLYLLMAFFRAKTFSKVVGIGWHLVYNLNSNDLLTEAKVLLHAYPTHCLRHVCHQQFFGNQTKTNNTKHSTSNFFQIKKKLWNFHSRATENIYHFSDEDRPI